MGILLGIRTKHLPTLASELLRVGNQLTSTLRKLAEGLFVDILPKLLRLNITFTLVGRRCGSTILLYRGLPRRN